MRDRALSALGTKVELISRLMELDPSGRWMTELGGNDVDGDVAHDDDADGEDHRENHVSRREIEIYRREKEIAERELELTRRELALLRECQNMDFVNRERQEKVVVNNMRGQ